MEELMAVEHLHILWDAKIPMRDGIHLSTDIYFPPEKGSYPIILERTPYDNSALNSSLTAEYFARRGFIFAIQDVRGRSDSDGLWDPWMNEGPDGYDTIEWLAQQSWCSGKIGMMGGSYLGFVQWMAAREQPPHLTALAATVSLGRWGHEFPFMNGKTNLETLRWLSMVGGRTQQMHSYYAEEGSLVDWNKIVRTRPMIDMDIALGRTNTVWREWLKHIALNDDYWKKIMLNGYYQNIDLPVLHITGWFDDDQVGALNYYKGMINESPARDRQYLMIGPWDHGGTRIPKIKLGDLEFSENALHDNLGIHLHWFNHWLKGEDNGVEREAHVKVYAIGKNVWKEYTAWPVPAAQSILFYLHSQGNANSNQGSGTLNTGLPEKEPADNYLYDPENPTPGLVNFPQDYYLPVEQSFAEKRRDVLVFTSTPLKDELEVTGVTYAILYAASDAVDTDFAVVLCDVFPDGRSIRLAENIMKASFRDSLEDPSLIEPGKTYCYKIELNAFSNVFLVGHCIRLDVMSARYPTWSRNPNTGAPEGWDLETKVAHQTIFHSSQYPSHLLMPVIKSKE
jgi:uncharacterized protein